MTSSPKTCTTCGKPADPHPYRHPITLMPDSPVATRLQTDADRITASGEDLNAEPDAWGDDEQPMTAEELDRANADTLLALRLELVLARITQGYTRQQVSDLTGWSMSKVAEFEERLDTSVRLSQLRRYALSIRMGWTWEVSHHKPE